MALNFYREINKKLAKKYIRFLQNNTKKLAQVTNALEESSQTQKSKKFNKFAISSQYRTTPPENPSLWANSFEAEQDLQERNLENQYLQPSTLPSYKEQPIFDDQFMAALQEGQITKAQNIATNNSASQIILESFKEKHAKNLPTRLPRFTSNPFPEPLKAVFSPYTLSDQDKADQMFQDQRMAYMKPTTDFSANPSTIKSAKKFYCTTAQLGARQETPGNGIQSFNSSGMIGNSSLDQVRSFSKKNEGGEVCTDESKKGKPRKPKKCVKMVIKGCPPARRNTICKQKNKPVKCTKVEAPYPSFSESCYMEPKGRTKECDLCPWTEKNNPNFRGKLKIPPKFYHTDCSTSSVRTSIIPETIRLGYCDTTPTALTEFFMKNGDLLRNFKNGDDLSSFGVKKSTLSRILSSDDIVDVVCKKGERIIPDYPRNCTIPYQDESKNCPTGLTKRKTKKERLKRKDSKDHKTN